MCQSVLEIIIFAIHLILFFNAIKLTKKGKNMYKPWLLIYMINICAMENPQWHCRAPLSLERPSTSQKVVPVLSRQYSDDEMHEEARSTYRQYIDCCGFMCLLGLAVCLDFCGCRKR